MTNKTRFKRLHAKNYSVNIDTYAVLEKYCTYWVPTGTVIRRDNCTELWILKSNDYLGWTNVCVNSLVYKTITV